MHLVQNIGLGRLFWKKKGNSVNMKDIYYNGTIHVKKGMDVQAMMVESGRIVKIGSLEQMPDWEKGHEVRLHDLKGCFVCPGFHDSHMHLLEYGYVLNTADLSHSTDTLSQMINALKDYGQTTDQGSWIVGRGWNHDYFQDENRFPNRYDLDLVSMDRPVLAYRACGHIACANSAALRATKITADSTQPEGGSFEVDEEGEPTGVFREYGINLISQAVPEPGKEEIKGFLIQAMDSLNSYGVTSVQTDDFCAFPGVSYEMVLDAYRELGAEGRLTVKVYEQCLLPELSMVREFISRGYCTGKGSSFFAIGPLKLLADGSLGARTALLSEPYSDDRENPLNCGIGIYTQEELNQLVAFASSNGMQTAVHAIGDKAMKMAVIAMEQAMAETENQKLTQRTDEGTRALKGRNRLRHGIVHCQITTRELIEDFKRLNLHAYIQSIFLDYDSHIVEKRVGEERAKDTYQFKTLLEEKVHVSNGSDCPVELPDVLAGIQCAVTRASLDGSAEFLKDQAMTVEEALESYTAMGAIASFEEQEKGRLLPGMAADFVILAEDIRTCRKEQIKEVKVLGTYLNGVCVYQ